MYMNLSIHDERPGTEVQAVDGALLFHESNGEWVVDEHLQHLTGTNTHTPKHTLCNIDMLAVCVLAR